MLGRLDRLFTLAFLVASATAANGQTFGPAIPPPEAPTSRITLPIQRPDVKFQLFSVSNPVSSAASSALLSKYDFSVPLEGLNGCRNNAYFEIIPSCQGKQVGPPSSGSPSSGGSTTPALKSTKSQGIGAIAVV
jgi:hypothetical protein